jgi:hypothetical protein
MSNAPGHKPDNEPDLGEPDFSNFMDDDTIEIDSHHVGSSSHASGAQGSSLPIGDTIAMSFVASRKGEHWRLNQDEAAELSTASQSVCDEYMPDFEMSPTWLLVGVVGAIAAPRLIIDAKINAKEQAQQEQAKQKEQSVNEPERAETPEYDTSE